MSLSYIKAASTLHWEVGGGGHLCRILAKVKQAQCLGAKKVGES